MKAGGQKRLPRDTGAADSKPHVYPSVTVHWRHRACQVANPYVSGSVSYDYFGVTSRANLLAITSRMSLRFFPASIIASREP
jgi:hypothetical protein